MSQAHDIYYPGQTVEVVNKQVFAVFKQDVMRVREIDKRIRLVTMGV